MLALSLQVIFQLRHAVAHHLECLNHTAFFCPCEMELLKAFLRQCEIKLVVKKNQLLAEQKKVQCRFRAVTSD